MAFKTRHYSVSSFLCLLFTFILNGCAFSNAQGAALTINVKNEGARGDGKTNDNDAFSKISKKVNDRGGNCKIVIPAGTYIIGKQDFYGTESKGSFQGKECLYFEKVRNVQIVSIGKVVFKYERNLKLGSFNPVTKQKEIVKLPFLNRKYVATIGCFLRIFQSSDISVSNLEADGNNMQIDYGGYWGDVGRQCLHVGIFIQNSKNISISKVYMHHFGLDGIEILSTDPANSNILVNDSKFEFNLRNGFSWVGGNGVTVRNCKFNYNGLGPNASNPRSGLDIEPEVAECENGTFEGCTFNDNGAAGFISDYHGKLVRKLSFNLCIFTGSTSCALFPNTGGIKIENSSIIGQVTSPSGLSSTNKTFFDRCKFYDYNPANQKKAYFATILIDAGGHQSCYEISNSTFDLKYAKLCYLESGSKDETMMPVFKNNIVYFNGDTYVNGDFIALFRGCILKDNTFNVNIKNMPPAGLYLITGHAMKFIGQNTIIDNGKKVGWNGPAGKKIITENK
jgi:hypothetical protein